MASLLGTLDLLEPEERALVAGLIVNRFRGDVTLFRDGVRFLEGRSGLPVLGVVPYLPDLRIADEDSVALERRPRGGPLPGAAVDVAVVRLPHIANFDEFAPLEMEPGVGLRYVEAAGDLGWPDVLILPGTKSTVADLGWLRRTRLAERVAGLAAAGSVVLGICGGYQMLGQRLLDPHGVEAAPGTSVPGLGLLPLDTTFLPDKTTRQAQGQVVAAEGPLGAVAGTLVKGYEIHMGQTAVTGEAGAAGPVVMLEGGRLDGALLPGGRVIGTYLHGLLDNAPLRQALLRWAAGRNGTRLESPPAPERTHDAEYDRLADTLEASLDLTRLSRIVGLPL